MKILRISSGFSNLDQHLKGGYPKGAVIAILGSGGTCKDRFSFNFLNTSNTSDSLIITTKYSISQIKQLSNEWNYSIKNAIFLDAVNWRIKRIQPQSNSPADYEVTNLTDLNALLAMIMKICNENKNIAKIYFHSPSSILLYNTPGPEQVYKFFELITAFTRSRDITFLYSLETDIHDPMIVSSMEFLSDGSLTVRCVNQLQVKINFMLYSDFQMDWIQLNS